MGNNAKKKVRSLPPLGKESKSRGRRRNEAPAGLDVQVPDRQRLIGSPAPQSFRNKLQERQQRFKKSGSSSDFPTITLSACEDSDDEDDEGFVQRDSVIQVGQVGGGLKSRTNSASGLSMSSIGGLVELHRSISARSGLTPPPRFLSMKDTHGNEVVSELSGALESQSEGEEKVKEEPAVKGKSGRQRRNSNLPSMSPSRSSSSHGGKLPSKYEPLEPIKTREGSQHSQHSHHSHHSRQGRHPRGHIGRRRRSCSD